MSAERREQEAAPGRALVTGCAGFIGSHLCERLVAQGWHVLGVDCFTPFYDRALKEANLGRLRDEAAFALREVDLAEAPLDGLTEGLDAVFHLAGEPGARQSFGAGAEVHERNNVRATERLLREAGERPPRVFVYASSSTTYGEAVVLPTPETAALDPISPYGTTKVAAERLVRRFSDGGLRSVVLRYFSGYGPRQRPDMAVSKFISQIARREPVPIYGDGRQLRDFTFVADLVEATVLAARAPAGSVYNVGGGDSVELREAVELLGELIGTRPELELRAAARGDVRETLADASRAADELGFSPRVALREGLEAQVEWALAAAATAGGPN